MNCFNYSYVESDAKAAAAAAATSAADFECVDSRYFREVFDYDRVIKRVCAATFGEDGGVIGSEIVVPTL